MPTYLTQPVAARRGCRGIRQLASIEGKSNAPKRIRSNVSPRFGVRHHHHRPHFSRHRVLHPSEDRQRERSPRHNCGSPSGHAAPETTRRVHRVRAHGGRGTGIEPRRTSVVQCRVSIPSRAKGRRVAALLRRPATKTGDGEHHFIRRIGDSRNEQNHFLFLIVGNPENFGSNRVLAIRKKLFYEWSP